MKYRLFLYQTIVPPRNFHLEVDLGPLSEKALGDPREIVQYGAGPSTSSVVQLLQQPSSEVLGWNPPFTVAPVKRQLRP